MDAKVTSLIICDDIRKEVTNKDILVGVYSGQINVTAYPALFNAAFWIEVEPFRSGVISCQFRIETPSGNPPIEFGADLHIDVVDTAVLVMAGVPLRVEHDGEIIFHAKLGDGEMEIVKRKRVIRGEFTPQPIQ